MGQTAILCSHSTSAGNSLCRLKAISTGTGAGRTNHLTWRASHTQNWEGRERECVALRAVEPIFSERAAFFIGELLTRAFDRDHGLLARTDTGAPVKPQSSTNVTPPSSF
jgi:hypothetical protein